MSSCPGLAKVALGYPASAATSFGQLQAEPNQASGLVFWMPGSVAGARWSGLLVPAIVIIVCVLLLLTRARALSAMSLGDDAAVAVGVDVRRERLMLLGLAALTTAVTVSLAGGVGFVGLIVPHATRMLVGGSPPPLTRGHSHRRELPDRRRPGRTLGGLSDRVPAHDLYRGGRSALLPRPHGPGEAIVSGIDLNSVSVSLGDEPSIPDVDFAMPAGAFVAVVGPNGSGKTTLLRAIYGAVRPSAGAVLIDGRAVVRMPASQAARLRAVVPQFQDADVALSAADIVGTGRHSHAPRWTVQRANERALVSEALRRTGIEALAERMFSTLSGGARQRVLLARALVQDAATLLLDEPTNHLDARAQLELMELLSGLPQTRAAVLHDLNQALAYADLIAVMHAGRLVTTGARPMCSQTNSPRQCSVCTRASCSTRQLDAHTCWLPPCRAEHTGAELLHLLRTLWAARIFTCVEPKNRPSRAHPSPASSAMRETAPRCSRPMRTSPGESLQVSLAWCLRPVRAMCIPCAFHVNYIC